MGYSAGPVGQGPLYNPALGATYQPTVQGQTWYPTIQPTNGSWGLSPADQLAQAQWGVGQYGRLGQNIIGMTPTYDVGLANQYGTELNAGSAASSAELAQKYGTGMMDAYNKMYQSGAASTIAAQQAANAATPGLSAWDASRQANLAQTQAEASGAAPQYLQDYWAKTANARLSGTMGAFGNTASQFAANQFGRYNADAANAYHNQALSNWQSSLNGYQPTTGMANIGTNNSYSALVQAYQPVNAYGTGVAAYGQQYGAQAGAAGNVQSGLTKRFIA